MSTLENLREGEKSLDPTVKLVIMRMDGYGNWGFVFSFFFPVCFFYQFPFN